MQQWQKHLHGMYAFYDDNEGIYIYKRVIKAGVVVYACVCICFHIAYIQSICIRKSVI